MIRKSIIASLLAAAAPAGAQTVAPGTEPAAICADRPAKGSATCVVDTGRLQYETDLVNYSHSRLDGVTTDAYLVTNPTFKYGLAKDVDVELNIAPWTIVRTHDDAGSSSVVRGAGDLFLRAKWNFATVLDGQLTATALPYVKVPTAKRGIGNRAVEGGLVLPISYQLTDKVTLTTGPEFDALKDANGNGRHLNTVQLVNVGYALPNSVTVYGELWGDWNIDPTGTVRQYSADVAVAWGITRSLQVDVGVNAGLNRNTPSVQAYVGLSQRF